MGCTHQVTPPAVEHRFSTAKPVLHLISCQFTWCTHAILSPFLSFHCTFQPFLILISPSSLQFYMYFTYIKYCMCYIVYIYISDTYIPIQHCCSPRQQQYPVVKNSLLKHLSQQWSSRILIVCVETMHLWWEHQPLHQRLGTSIEGLVWEGFDSVSVLISSFLWRHENFSIRAYFVKLFWE